MTTRNHAFTLIEVVVSLGILGMGLVAFLTLANASQQRLIKAKERWQHAHMAAQAAEFFLLQPSEDPADIELDFFDYPGYKAVCYYTDPEELPEEFNNLELQAPLRSCVIELIRTSDDKTLETLIIDRIMYDSAGSGGSGNNNSSNNNSSGGGRTGGGGGGRTGGGGGGTGGGGGGGGPGGGTGGSGGGGGGGGGGPGGGGGGGGPGGGGGGGGPGGGGGGGPGGGGPGGGGEN
jgi:prepilin-type N-terminal cleavage/methylation domain-containing protein